MAALSITKAWNEALAFVQRESRLVLPIAFLLVTLPVAALQLAMPTPDTAAPADPAAFLRALRPALLFLPLVAILGAIGSIALSYLAIVPARSVGEALQTGGRRFVFLLLATLLIGFVAMIPLFVMLMAAGALGGERGIGLLVLLMLIYIFLVLAAWIRLILMTPVCAVEKAGPIELIRRSWTLTRGHFARLLGFFILFWIAALVALFAFQILFGLIVAIAVGVPVPGSTAAFVVLLLTAVPQAIANCLFITMVARIYVQLAGSGPGAVFA